MKQMCRLNGSVKFENPSMHLDKMFVRPRNERIRIVILVCPCFSPHLLCQYPVRFWIQKVAYQTHYMCIFLGVGGGGDCVAPTLYRSYDDFPSLAVLAEEDLRLLLQA
jgi:hypothetical protein